MDQGTGLGGVRLRQQLCSHERPSLGKRAEQVIRGLYLQGKSQKDLAAEIGVVPRTVRRVRDEAIERLAALYSYAETVHGDIPGQKS